jgi:hypothetical protein
MFGLDEHGNIDDRELQELKELAETKEDLINAFDDLMQEYTKAEIDECKQAILHHKELESKPIRPNFQLLSEWQHDPLFKVLAEIDI